MNESRGKTVKIRNKAGGVVASADPALAGELVARGGWELAEKSKPAPKPKETSDDE